MIIPNSEGRMIRSFCIGVCAAAGFAVDLEPAAAATVSAQATSARSTVVRGTLVDDTARAFGEFNGIAYSWHNGYFEGETSRGRFRVLYVLIAPADPSRGNGAVLFEPPHPANGPVGRDVAIGRDFLFGRGFSYAGAGWANLGRALLNPESTGKVIGGQPVVPQPPFGGRGVIADVEILVQFARALTTDSTAIRILGPIDRQYAYGVSASTGALLELQRRVVADGGRIPFDLAVLHGAGWGGPAPPGMWEFLGGEFEPVAAGRVMFVQSEGDLLIGGARQLRKAASAPSYRIYEVAGAAHLPSETNGLEHPAVARALLIAGDSWIRAGVEPPPSAMLEAAPPDQIDPLYGRVTGIARDGDLNARGGIRLPDVAVGRARFVASDIATVPPGFPPPMGIVTGSVVDLACEPAAAVPDSGPRFGDAAEYRRAVETALSELTERRLLVDADVAAFRARALAWSFGPCR
jgi:hypothetical protein